MNAMKTIRVTGKGQLKVRPDTTRITLTLEGTCPDYGEALKSSAQDTEQLKDLLAGFGFDRSDLKTLNFRIDTEYQTYKEKGTYKQRFVGYQYEHLMKVEFSSDQERLGRLLYALAHCAVKPEFRLSYTVADPEAAKNTLLGKAVSDAREKAGTLTQAAGVPLKGIQSIDYSWGTVDFEVQPTDTLPMAALETDAPAARLSSYNLDIEPDDIEISDTVTVIWEIG